MSRFRGDLGPPVLTGEHRIAVWAPGTEVRLDKPLSGAFFFRLPLTLVALAVPAMWVGRLRAEPGLTGQAVLSSIVVGIVGLWLGLSSLSAARRALPERVTFHWPSGRLRVSGFRRPMEIPLAAITAIEVRGVRVLVSRGESDMDMSRTPRYKCLLRAHYGESPTTPTRMLGLTETEFVTDDPPQ